MAKAAAIIAPVFYGWNPTTGAPLAGGKLYAYEPGTSTPKDTYTDESGDTPNAHPVILNASGYAPVYLKGEYKIVLHDASDNEVWSKDPVTGPASLAEEWIKETDASQVDATSFTVEGDQTGTFEAGRRVRLEDDTTLYATIDSAVYASPETTVTVTVDGGAAITASLSSASVSILSALKVNTSSGSGQLLEDALDARVIFVETLSDLKNLDPNHLSEGQQVNITTTGRAGSFVIKSGSAPNDPEEGVYVAIDASTYAERIHNEEVYIEWFGGVVGQTGNEAAYRAAMATKKLRVLEGYGDGDQVVIYCDPVNGSDDNVGSQTSPVKTLQEACNRVPKVLRGIYIEINCRDATTISLPATYDEDVRFGPVFSSGTGSAAEGNIGKVKVKGDPSTPTNCELGSFIATGVIGPKSCSLEGFHMLRVAPDDGNESAPVQAHTSQEVGVSDISFATAMRRGVLAYTATMDVRSVDVTNITDHPFSAKRSGKMTVQSATGTFEPTHDASTTPFEAREDSRISYINDGITYAGNGEPGGTVSDGGSVLDADRELTWSSDFKYFAVVASATRDSNLLASTGVATTFSLNEIISDNGGQVDTSNNYIRVRRDGLYLVKVRLSILNSSISSGDGLRVRIVDGNDTVIAENMMIYQGGASVPHTTVQVETIIDLFDSGSLDRQIRAELLYEGSGDATIAASRRYSEFSIQKLG